jgi:hypothetical protein
MKAIANMKTSILDPTILLSAGKLGKIGTIIKQVVEITKYPSEVDLASPIEA